MSEADRRLQALVAAVSDGLPVDWGQAESTARSDDERAVVRQLRVLAGVASVHRDLEQTQSSAALPADAADDLEQWGRLALRERVGRGGYGTVYRAWDPGLDREVALKLLADERVDEEAFRESVVAEGRLLARVKHPNVIDVYGADTHEGRVGFWMEFLEGQTLKQRVDEHGPMSSREATLIGIDVARALAAVHAAGLLHRDIKAQNVMREDGGRTVLMDFGAGVERDRIAGLAGTPLYMAPEVLAGAQATVASDVYSVGVLLYFLVSGRFPVVGSSLEEIRHAHGEGARHTLRDVRPGLPSAFVRVVERALSPDPGKRPATAGLLENALAASLELSTDSTPLPQPDATTRGTAWRRWIMAGLATTAIIVALWSSGIGPAIEHYVWPGVRVNSLAVLPLENLGATDQKYFTDGMSDLLTTNLAKLKALRVISSASMQRLDAHESIHDIGTKLGVDAVLRGSLLWDGNRLRVTAQLFSTRDESSLWAETYERDVRDAFTLQSDLARDIARGINLTVTPQEQQDLTSTGPASDEARDEYLKGYTAIERFTSDGAEDAVPHFERAVQLDPTYARAYTSLAYAYTLLSAGYGRGSRDEIFGKARAAALKALELDDGLASAHYGLGMVQFYYDWDWLGAQASFQSAIELAPGDAEAHQRYASYLEARGMLPEALDQMQKARLLDPLGYTRRQALAEVYYYMRRYDDAVKELNAAIAVDRSFKVAAFVLGRVYGAMGMTSQAVAELEASDAPRNRVEAEVARVLAQAGRAAEAQRMVDRLESRASGNPAAVGSDALAFAYAALGQPDRAFDLLNRAVADRSPTVLFIKVDPRLDPLRRDPRFARLVTTIGIP